MALKTINCPFLAYISKTAATDNTTDNYDWLGGWTRADENKTYNCSYFIFEPPNTTGLSYANAWHSLNFQGKFYIEDIQVGEERCDINLIIDFIDQFTAGDVVITDGEPVMNSFHYHQNFSQAISTSSSSYPITQNETSVTKTAPLKFSFGYNFDSIAVHTKTSTNKKGIWAWDKYRVCLKNKNYSSLQLSFYYTPGCYVSYTNTGNTTISRQTYTNEANISWPTTPTRTGYHFNGWIIDNVLHDPEDPNTSIYQTGDKDITATGDWTRQYQIIFNKVLSDATFSYTQSNYNNKIAGDIPTTPNAPTIATHQFMGWTSNSSKTIYDSTWHGTKNSSGQFWSTGTNLPAIAYNQAGSTPTTAGFPINYYAVWQERDSITINENVSNVATISVTNSAATSGNTYYFNPNQNITITISVTSESYYLDTITSTTSTNLITNGSIDTDQKIWTSGTITSGTSSTAITINVVYVEGYTAFYGKENVSTPQRVIKIYWEDTRAVDLYYENTRLI